MALLGLLLLGAQSAPALTPASTSSSEPELLEIVKDVNSEEEALNGEEDEEGEEEWEEGAEEEGEELYPPEECLLQTARARVLTYTSQDKVQLFVAYTAVVPTPVTVDYRLAGNKGSLNLGQVTQRFSKRGLFHLTERLSDAEMAKALSAKSFTVHLDVPGAPRYCSRFSTRHLTQKRIAHNQIVWSQSDSIFGTGQ